jgi:hypothetical protein
MSRRSASPDRSSPADSAASEKRVLQSRYDQEIENEMDRSGLSYRTGWPRLPPLPVNTETSGARISIENAEHDIQTAETSPKTQQVT